MRFAYAAIIALVVAVFLPYSAAAAQISTGFDVTSARIAAEQQLVAMGISPGDATFQIGARNYAGSNCPGSGWNCTSASVVVQIATSAATLSTASNTFQCSPAAPGSASPNLCFVAQTSLGNNTAVCVEPTNDNAPSQQQWCVISQTTTGPGKTNSAFIDQRIMQSTAEGTQTANQNVILNQANVNGINSAIVAQTIIQNQFKSVRPLSPSATQIQEGHQRLDLCQGGPNPCQNITAGSGPNPRNIAGVAQTNLQKVAVAFTDSTAGTIDQAQNTMPSEGARSLAVVRQNSSDKANDSGLLQFSREIATVFDGRDVDDDYRLTSSGGFTGPVTQSQGHSDTCSDDGLCGFIFQDSAGVQRAFPRQDELQKAQGPAAANQTQFGPEFCCTTQTKNGLAVTVNEANVVNIVQLKTQLHTSSATQGLIQGHCLSESTNNDNCSVSQRLTQNNMTQSNSCNSGSCNIVVTCTSSVECAGFGEGTPAIPPVPCAPGTCILLLRPAARWNDHTSLTT